MPNETTEIASGMDLSPASMDIWRGLISGIGEINQDARAVTEQVPDDLDPVESAKLLLLNSIATSLHLSCAMSFAMAEAMVKNAQANAGNGQPQGKWVPPKPKKEPKPPSDKEIMGNVLDFVTKAPT
jgi:hypothetical protein